MSGNGQVPAGQAERVRLDPGDVTMGDLRRAKVALGGRNPYELLEDPIEAIILTIWVHKSRVDPTYTMEQAAAEPMRGFDFTGGEPDPPTGPGGSPGPGSGKSAPTGGRRRQPAATDAPS